MTTITVMPVDSFCVEQLRRLYDEERFDRQGKQITRDAKNYVEQYFFPTTSGSVLFWNGFLQTFVWYDEARFRFAFLNRFPSELQNWFLTETKLYQETSAKDKPFVYTDKIIFVNPTSEPAKETTEIITDTITESEIKIDKPEITTEEKQDSNIGIALTLASEFFSGKKKPEDIKSVSITKTKVLKGRNKKTQAEESDC